MLAMARSPSSARTLRQTYLRSVGKALTVWSRDGDPSLLDKALGQMEAWTDKAQAALDHDPDLGVAALDPRVSWRLWAEGSTGVSSSQTEPLPCILSIPTVPMAFKRRALALADRLLALCPHELGAPGQRSLIQPETWLLAANVPGIDAFVNAHEVHLRTDPKVPLHKQWERSWCNLIAGGCTLIERSTLRVSFLQGQKGFDLAHHEHTVFAAALQHGWANLPALERWPSPYHPGKNHPASERLRQVPLNAQEAGSLLDVLAAAGSNGVLDLWRASRPNDWSTWVNPSTGTTVWRSLLLGDDPALIGRWLADDPDALDRPVPNGRWIHDSDGLGNARRAFAATTWNEQDLADALLHAESSGQAARLQAWWDNPAPTVRDTVWALTEHVFPSATPFLERAGWYDLVRTIEARELRATMDTDPARILDPLVSKPRARL